jgi:hypothetical protein
MSKSMYVLAAAATLGLSALAGSAAASAAPASAGAGVASENPNLVQIDSRWHRDRHGRRCSHRSGGCRHFYRGFYYESPWWTLPLVLGGIGANRYHDDDFAYEEFDRASMGSDHIEWCRDRYRSYNVRTNTWVSYSGRVRECISPFS